MATLMKHTLSTPPILIFSAQFPFYTTHNSNTCSFALKFTYFGFLSGEKSMLWPIKVKNSRNVLFSSIPTRDIEEVSEKGELFSLFGVLGLDEKEVEAVLTKNPSLGLLPVESIRSRIHGLQSIGLNEGAFFKLICKNPDILTADEIGYLIEFINGLGNTIESVQIERLLLNTLPSFIGGFEKKVKLLVEYGIPEEKISHILNNINLSKSICLRSCEEITRMLTFLSRFDAVGIISKRPSTLHFDLDNQLVPRIGFLQKLSGGSSEGVGEVLCKLPAILSYTVEHMQNHVEFFRSFASLTDKQIFKIVHVYPNVMSTSVHRKLRPRVEFLKECGLDTAEIYRFLVRAPLFLGLSFERNLSLKLAILVKIGYAYRTKELVMAMGAATRTRCEHLQGVIGLFLSYGYSCEDIVAMSNKHFQILQYNPKSLEEKMEYLIEEMDREIGELLSFPAFLGYNLDNRIKHRYELKKNVAGEDMSLNKLMTVSSENFSKKKKKGLVQVSSRLDEEDTETDEMVYDTTL